MHENGNAYNIITRPCEGKTEIKKSVFIAELATVKSEDEARAFLEDVKKRHREANHHCFSIRIGEPGSEYERFSDDGEPQGTAGLPVFNVVKMSGATDLVVVVTRYFGGILLGAGGLVRAYSAAAKMATDAAGLASFEPYAVYTLDVTYSDYQKLTPALEKIRVSPDRTEFLENVRVTAAIEAEREEELQTLVSELTAGKGNVQLIGREERASRL